MAAKPRPGQSFSQFASKVLSSTFLESTPQDAPLFYSTANWEVSVAGEDDILGRSDDSLPLHSSSRVGEGRGLSLDSDREEEREEDREETGAPGFPSRLWERARLPLGGVSRGWRAHESVLPPPPADIYSSEYDDSDTPDSPPSFLSPALPLPQAPLTEPLLPATTLYIYPSTRSLGGGGGAQVYRNSRWIAAYGCCILAVSYLGVREWWAGTADSSKLPTILPTLPVLAILSLASVVAGGSAFAYLVIVHNAVRHVVLAALFGGPFGIVACGLIAFSGSMGGGGVEDDAGWKTGVRIFALCCFVAAFLLTRAVVARRMKVDKTIQVLELATSIIIAHPPLVLLSLALSFFSTILSLPFLFTIAGLLSHGEASSAWIPHGAARWEAVGVLLVLAWTMAILRGTQKVTIAGVVGSWYFNRHEASHPSPFDATRMAFARARGPSIGTIFASSFFVALFQTLAVLARRARTALRSTTLPALLHPLTYLAPLLAIIAGTLEIYTGWILTYTGLTGEDFLTSAHKARALLSRNGTVTHSVLIKLVLFLLSTTWGLLAGLTAFLIASSRLGDPHLAPIVAALCFLLPFWTVELTGSFIGDAADACFLCVLFDVETNTVHCAKALEAFGGDVESR